MSDSDSDKITGLQLWKDVAAILVNETVKNSDMVYQVPKQSYNDDRFKDFLKIKVFNFQTIKYYFQQQRENDDIFIPEIANRLPSLESFQKLNDFFDAFGEWCREKIDSIQTFLNEPYGNDLDDTTGVIEYTLSHESAGTKRSDIKKAIKKLSKYGFNRADEPHLLKIADLIRFLNFFVIDMIKVTDNITPLGGPTQTKQPPYITQMDPIALDSFKALFSKPQYNPRARTVLDTINGYGEEDDEYSEPGAAGNKRRTFRGIGKDLIKPIDDAVDKFFKQYNAARAKKSSAPPAPSSLT